MIIGYILGCLFSILIWKLDRHIFFRKIDNSFFFIKNILLRELIYLGFFICIFFALNNLKLYKYKDVYEIYDFLTAFFAIDISNIERKSTIIKGKTSFDNSISKISQAICCGFIAPMFYIMLKGNSMVIFYMLIYMSSFNKNYRIIDIINKLLNIVPCIITDMLLYIFYVLKNRKLYINFNGNLLCNIFLNPILNINILAANIEKVSFYYECHRKSKSYLVFYGKFNNNISVKCLKNYLSLIYSIAFLVFTILVLHFLL